MKLKTKLHFLKRLFFPAKPMAPKAANYLAFRLMMDYATEFERLYPTNTIELAFSPSRNVMAYVWPKVVEDLYLADADITTVDWNEVNGLIAQYGKQSIVNNPQVDAAHRLAVKQAINNMTSTNMN